MKRPTTSADIGRMLGGVKIAASRAKKAVDELDRNVVRAAAYGASLRDIAKAAGFDSHNRVQLILQRDRLARAQAETESSGSSGDG